MSTTTDITLLPRDGFFFKSGHGWFTSESNRAEGLSWPFPPTVLGALRTAYGKGLELQRGTMLQDAAGWLDATDGVRLHRMLGVRRLLGTGVWRQAHRLWPAPQDALLAEDGRLVRLLPAGQATPVIGLNDDPARDGLYRPALANLAKPDAMPPWWPEAAFVKWISGHEATVDDLAPASAAGRPRAESLANVNEIPVRVDIHLGIDSGTQTASEGMLYSVPVREQLQRIGRDVWEWGVAVRLSLPGPAELPLVTLGGDRRPATVDRRLDGNLFDAPAGFSGPCSGLRLIVVTPACFERGWLPDRFAPREGRFMGDLPGVTGDLVLRAAMVSRPSALSGWDMARREPRSTALLVPAGSVYFLEKADGGAFSAGELESLWFAALGARQDEGLGLVVPAVWKR